MSSLQCSLQANKISPNIQKQSFLSTILLVDDRPENLLVLENVLENGKRKFISVASGNEALKVALKEPLSLILMDIQMPDMDGIETSRLLRLNPRTSHIPIIFVSAIDPKEKQNLNEFEAGTVDFLIKPLDISDTQIKVAFFENLLMKQQELNQIKKELEASKESFERFVYLISHDLKTPLRALTNIASWINDDLGETNNQPVKENLCLLKDRVSRLNYMIDAIMEYSRAGKNQEEKTTILFKEFLFGIFETIPNAQLFKLEVVADEKSIYSEKQKLEKIFRQLLTNAVEHHDKKEGNITVSFITENGQAIFSVADDGPGIKTIHQKTIFELFQTLVPKDEKQNTGAGLAIVKKEVTHRGGCIYVENNNITGSKFVFSWPL